MKSILRRAIRYAAAVIFCLIVAIVILTDPLFAAVMSAGSRMRRPRPEKTAIAGASTSNASRESP